MLVKKEITLTLNKSKYDQNKKKRIIEITIQIIKNEIDIHYVDTRIKSFSLRLHSLSASNLFEYEIKSDLDVSSEK